jgi:short-subunit dehydrogenase
MTRDYKKGLLWAKPEAVARGIHKAMKKGKGVAYLPPFWRLIMLVIRNLPDFVFNRSKL